ncbi:MAG: late sigma transcription factor [Wendovervirus sonii]|uniref:Late sigma transcription factor n=1 Tax=phage Lak_Megaphage_Sonny TaxID=3109229 RepID=A0ABZ0Z704_9CAUD|nr:MAG: late sigma transcription factor [phage Lak_Megaphage_Sonny]
MALPIDKDVEGIKIKKDGKEYVSNPILLQEILISKEKGELTYNALQMLMMMVENISNAKRYPSQEEKEDCQQQAVLDVLQYWQGFDPDKSSSPNPFAYFTSIIINGIAKGWNSLHPQNKKAKGCVFTSLDNNVYTI